MAGESLDGQPVVLESEAATIAALNHARTMLLCQVEVRAKNFNFFLVIVGALAVALCQWNDLTVRAIQLTDSPTQPTVPSLRGGRG